MALRDIAEDFIVGKTYTGEFVCTNCKQKQTLKIPLGVTVDKFKKEKGKCKFCGCKTLKLK